MAAKFKSVCLSSAELHHTILFAYGLTRDMNALESMSPSVSRLFTASSLFLETRSATEASTQNYELVDRLLIEHTKKLVGPIVDRIELADIELVGKSIGIDAKYVRTRFFVEAYRYGKDSSIDDLLASNIAYLDKQLFLDEIVHIICERLDSTISSLKKSKSYRGVVSVLDANTIRWVREETSHEASAQNNQAPVSLIATQSLVTRIQSMSQSVSDEILERKISDLSVMSAALLKAVQSQEQRAINI